MVIDNIEQTQTFFDVLEVIDSVFTTSVAVFNNYLDKNPDDTAHHTFKDGIYSVTINCSATHIYYVLDFTTNHLPLIGEQTVQIFLSMDILSKVKEVRIQIGDANALKYVIDGNKTTFAIKYLDTESSSITAYFSIETDRKNNVIGHVYEYLTVGNLEHASTADFYIADDYVSVVGNKADGIPGFKGYICELYSVDTGKLEGYEVRESLDVLGADIVTLNTLWFDLDNISGINSVKYNSEEKAFFVNGSSRAWETKKFGVLNLLKQFDIEFRTQYFYHYDSEKQAYEEIKVEVPMLFVREEKLSDFPDDVKSTNNITVAVTMNQADLNKLMSDYDTLVDILIENTKEISSTDIKDFIGQKKTFN